MAFKDDIPEFRAIADGELYMHTVPDEIWTPMESLIRKAAANADKLRAIINNIAEITGGQMTNNWGWNFLENDIPDCVAGIRQMVKGKRVEHFEAFMDCLGVLHDIGDLTVDDINRFLEDYGIGYRCDSERGVGLTWSPIENISVVDDIVDAQIQIKSLSQQAYERFESALRQFEDVSCDERARKDAVRSCIDAMEALIKELGAEEEIGNATKRLKDEKDGNGVLLWGPVEMVKDGNNLFNLLHKLYPDVRHGTQDITTANMSIEEAEYFVRRITAYVKYMTARAKKLGRF